MGGVGDDGDDGGGPDHPPVQVVEEGEQVEGELHPALPLALVQRVRVHDGGGIVQARTRHHWTVHVPETGFLQNLIPYP